MFTLTAVALFAFAAPATATEDEDLFFLEDCALQEQDIITCNFSRVTATLDWETEEICVEGDFSCSGEGLSVSGTINRCFTFAQLRAMLDTISGEEEEGGEGNGGGNDGGNGA